MISMVCQQKIAIDISILSHLPDVTISKPKKLEWESNPNSLFSLITTSPGWYHGNILVALWSALSASSSFLNTETILSVFIYCGNLINFNDSIKFTNSTCHSKNMS